MGANAVALYGIHMVQIALPLLTIPYLARVLGATVWGEVAVAQAVGGYVLILVEYGFQFSATRDIARARDSVKRLAEVASSVWLAKLLLTALGAALAFLAQLFVPAMREQPLLLWSGVLWAVGQSLSFSWYFQGLERMRVVAKLEIAARVVGTACIFLLVRSPDDAWKVLAVPGLASGTAVVVSLWIILREVPFRLPSALSIALALRDGWAIFLWQAAVSLLTVTNVLLLGFFAVPQVVGYYAGAEKISRAAVGLLWPLSRALYPRISHLLGESKDEALKMVRVSAILVGGAGALLGGVTFVFADLAVGLLLGDEFKPAATVLRILALQIPLVAINGALGIQWMLPLGMDRWYTTVLLVAGAANVAAALVLAPRLGALGMALAVLTAEVLVAFGIYIVLRRQGADPFRSSPKLYADVGATG